MTQEEFALRVGLSPASWWQVLHGRRNLGWRNAKKVAKQMGGDPNLWRDGGAKSDRLKVWSKFQNQGKIT